MSRRRFRNTRRLAVARFSAGADRPQTAGPGASYAGVKDEAVGSLATQHLIEQGCRRIARIRGPANSTGTGRLRGYGRMLRGSGFERGGYDTALIFIIERRRTP